VRLYAAPAFLTITAPARQLSLPLPHLPAIEWKRWKWILIPLAVFLITRLVIFGSAAAERSEPLAPAPGQPVSGHLGALG